MELFVEPKMTPDGIKVGVTSTPTKKRGRPAASKPKPLAKPRFRLLGFDTAEIVEKLTEIAFLIDPACRSSKAAQVRVAAELLELIENKKA